MFLTCVMLILERGEHYIEEGIRLYPNEVEGVEKGIFNPPRWFCPA